MSQVFPTPVTSGRGKRILIEGESGCGKSYLSAMLAYQWSSHKAYFANDFNYFVYLDARLVKGPLHKAVHSLVS